MVLNAINLFTGHGLSNIVSAETFFAKITWSVFLLLFFISCCIYIYNSFTGYLAFDVISNIKILDKTELTFPAIVFCGWYSDNSIADSIVFCTFNKQDCQSNKINFEQIIATGYGLSFQHNCIRINGQKASNKNKNLLLSVKQPNIWETGLSIGFIVPEGVRFKLLYKFQIWNFFVI